MTMENQYFLRQLMEHRGRQDLKSPVDKAVEAYCDAVYAEYTGIAEVEGMIKTEKARLVAVSGWEEREIDAFERTISLCKSLPMEPMYAEFAKGSYLREIGRE